MQMDRYKDWRIEELCKAEKELLMTLKEIRKERKDDDENSLDHDQTDQMKDCVMALCHIVKMRHMHTMMYPETPASTNSTMHMHNA